MIQNQNYEHMQSFLAILAQLLYHLNQLIQDGDRSCGETIILPTREDYARILRRYCEISRNTRGMTSVNIQISWDSENWIIKHTEL